MTFARVGCFDRFGGKAMVSKGIVCAKHIAWICAMFAVSAGGPAALAQSTCSAADIESGHCAPNPMPTPRTPEELRTEYISARKPLIDSGVSYLDWYIFWASAGDDPFFAGGGERDRGTGFSTASGTSFGQTLRSRSTSLGGGVDGHFAIPYTVELGAAERLVFAGIYRYDAYSRSFGFDPSLPAFARSGSVGQDAHRLAGLVRYEFGASHVGLVVGGKLGSGNDRDFVLGSTGHFRSSGAFTLATAGHTFTLMDTTGAAQPFGPFRTAPRGSGGYAIGLDLTGYGGYLDDRIDRFTNSAGFTRGKEELTRGVSGARAKLLATTTWGRLTWSPYVMASVDSEFGFSHKLTIPAQVLSTPDLVSYGGPQTYWGGGGGIDWTDASGIRFGVGGYYRRSAQYDVAGGQAYIKFPVSDWLNRTFAGR